MRRKEMKYGRRLRGPEQGDAERVQQEGQGEGIGIKIDDLKEMIRIPSKAEPQHVQIMADTGAGRRPSSCRSFARFAAVGIRRSSMTRRWSSSSASMTRSAVTSSLIRSTSGAPTGDLRKSCVESRSERDRGLAFSTATG